MPSPRVESNRRTINRGAIAAALLASFAGSPFPDNPGRGLGLASAGTAWAAQPAEGDQLLEGDEVFVSLKFRGGLLSEYVRAIHEAAKNTPLNIVLKGSAERATIPPLELREVAISTAIESAAEMAVHPAGPLSLSVVGESNAGRAVYVLAVRVPNDGFALTTSIFSLASLLSEPPLRLSNPVPGQLAPGQPAPAQTSGRQEGDRARDDRSAPASELGGLPSFPEDVAQAAPLDDNTILSAIEAALSLSNDPSQLKFHAESRLLIVRGSREDVDVVRSVLAALERDAQRVRERAALIRQQHLEVALDGVQLRLQEISSELNMVRGNAHNLRSVRDSGQGINDDVLRGLEARDAALTERREALVLAQSRLQAEMALLNEASSNANLRRALSPLAPTIAPSTPAPVPAGK
ncbi:MAG: hypothetical protein SFZ23_09355 [Planctomycetota bacterium]|nr:hypothetical protein [Planctomycetota bacterium]